MCRGQASPRNRIAVMRASTGAKSCLVTRAEATKAQMRDNVYYGYRTAITRSGKWQFFIAGD